MIAVFHGSFAFLSNFYTHPIYFDGLTYPTLEHAYQAAKTVYPHERLFIQSLPTAGDAKRRGRAIELRSDWEAMKNDIMLNLLRTKFSTNPMRDLLLGTGEQFLIEGNWWGDKYWGVCKGDGRNILGHLLMQVRDEIRNSR